METPGHVEQKLQLHGIRHLKGGSVNVIGIIAAHKLFYMVIGKSQKNLISLFGLDETCHGKLSHKSLPLAFFHVSHIIRRGWF